MQEEEYHDDFYEHEATEIFSSKIFIEAQKKECDFLIKKINKLPNNQVLSLGSGDGSLDLKMAPLVEHILGVEISSTAVKQAQANAKSAHLTNVDFQVGDIQTLSFPANSFDIIWAPAVLHHIEEEVICDLLQRSMSWLKPGGIFISMDPSSRRFVGLFKRLVADTYDKYHSPDERELDIKALATTFQQAGFSHVQVHYIDYFLSPVAWLFPQFPNLFIPAISALDSLLLSIPIIKLFASSFAVVAKK